MSEKKVKGPMEIHPFLLLFLVIAVCAALSYVIPAGEFKRTQVDGRTVVDPESFHYVEAKPVGFLDLFRSIPQGIAGASAVVILVLMVGGAIEIFSATGALNVGIAKMVSVFGKKGDMWVLLALMVFLGILGGWLGWIEAALPFMPLVVAVVIGLGYDAMTAAGVTIIGCMLPFAVGPTNMYTVGISHTIAELPMFSGLGFRTVVFVLFTALGFGYVLRYARITKADPSRSLVKDIDTSDLMFDVKEYQKAEFTTRHKIVLAILFAAFAMVVYGMLKLKWTINDMAAVFVLAGAAAALAGGIGANAAMTLFVKGAQKNLFGALIVGVARGIQWIMDKGGIQDTIIHGLSLPMKSMPTWINALWIFVVILMLDFLFSSGSGKAMAVMPIIIPLADIIGLTRQTAVQAYQFGDGLTNLLWFTYGTLHVFLAYAKVPFGKWVRFFMPLMVVITILSVIFLIIAVKINYGPF